MLYLIIVATLVVALFTALFEVSSEAHHNPFADLLAYIGPLSAVGLFALFGEGLRKILCESIVVCEGWVSWLMYAVVGVFAAFFFKCGKESTRTERESLKEKIAEMQERELWNNVVASCEEVIKTVDEAMVSRSEDDK
jgi:hypothetical protein